MFSRRTKSMPTAGADETGEQEGGGASSFQSLLSFHPTQPQPQQAQPHAQGQSQSQPQSALALTPTATLAPGLVGTSPTTTSSSAGPFGVPPLVPLHNRFNRSRASSIVSTRTGISIGTLQDDARSTRSIDLSLGGRMFHINRDASRITVSEEGELPPYSPPAPAYSQILLDSAGYSRMSSSAQQAAAPQTSGGGAFAIPRKPPRPQSLTPDMLSTSPLPLTPSTRRSTSATTSSNAEQTVWRSPSFDPGPESITVLPKRRSASQGTIPDNTLPRSRPAVENPRLRRRGGVRLPRLFIGLANNNKSDTNLGGDSIGGGASGAATGDRSFLLDPEATSPNSDPIVHSAGPSFPPQELLQPGRPNSPSYIGKNATGLFSRNSKSTTTTSLRSSSLLSGRTHSRIPR